MEREGRSCNLKIKGGKEGLKRRKVGEKKEGTKGKQKEDEGAEGGT